MKKNKSQYTIICLKLITAIALLTTTYLTINNNIQEKNLKKEFIIITTKDLTKDDYNTKIKTKGNYADIEKTIKKYYQELSNNIKIINSNLTNKQLINILSAENLEKDGPNFETSLTLITKAKDETNEAMNNINKLYQEETIKNYIEQDKINKKSYQLYLDLIANDQNLKQLTTIKEEMQLTTNNLNTFFNKIQAMLNFLKEKKDSWFIKDNQLFFKTNSEVTQYNNLYNDLDKFVKEKFQTTPTKDNLSATKKM